MTYYTVQNWIQNKQVQNVVCDLFFSVHSILLNFIDKSKTFTIFPSPA